MARERSARILQPGGMGAALPGDGAAARERLLKALTLLSSSSAGYRSVTVAEVVALAGVSRATFYEHFNDREDCLLAALEPIGMRLLAGVERQTLRDGPEHAAAGIVRAVLAFADADPAGSRVLFSESLAAGRRALDARDRLIAQLARIVDDAYLRMPAETPAPDLPSDVLLGTVCRLLAWLLAGREPPSRGLAAQLCGWLKLYVRPLGEHRYRAQRPVSEGRGAWRTTPPVPRPALGGRHRSDRAGVEDQRLQIVLATAEVVAGVGYTSATVSAIARRAGVDMRSFHRLFADKSAALAAVPELLFRQAMAASAAAYVRGGSWPEHVFYAAQALVSCAQESPALVSVSLIDSQASDPASAARVADIARAFTVFLKEGFREQSARPGPPHTALEPIAAACFELGYLQIRDAGEAQRRDVLGLLSFLCLAPFVGAGDANDFLDRQAGLGPEPLDTPGGGAAPYLGRSVLSAAVASAAGGLPFCGAPSSREP